MKGLLKELRILISLFLLHYLDTSGSTTTVAVAAAASTATAPEAVAVAEDKAKAASSQILPDIHKQHYELSHEILHVLEVSRGFEKPTSTNSDSAQRGLKKKKQSQKNKRIRERASEPEGKGGKNSAQAKSSAIDFSFYEAVVRQRDTCQEKLRVCKEERDTYQAERDALKLKEALPEYLYVQQADKCVVKRGEEVGQFILESSAFLDVTERFTDKPLRFESSLSTDKWFASRFNDIFGESSPNTAMAMVNEGKSKGTVVAVYSSAYPGSINQDGETVYAYKMYQSPDQASIASLEALLGDADEVTIDFCSMFIDDSSGTPCWDNEDCQSGSYCDFDFDNCPPEANTCGKCKPLPTPCYTNEVCQSENRLSYCHFDFVNCPPEANTCGKCKAYNTMTQCEKGKGTSPILNENLFEINRTKPFTLCFQAYAEDYTYDGTTKYCWSEAYYDVNIGRFNACLPDGYWSAVLSSEDCGTGEPIQPCVTFAPYEPNQCCQPAWGEFGDLDLFGDFKTDDGKLSQNAPFHTCWEAFTDASHNTRTGQYCWTLSWYNHYKSEYELCWPKGYWTATKSVPANGCGPPCEEFEGLPVC